MISRILLGHLLHDKTYANKVLPFLKESYFPDKVDKAVIRAYAKFVGKYHKHPTLDAIYVDVESVGSGLGDDEFDEFKQFLSQDAPEKAELEWLVDETEKFCRDAAIRDAVYKAMDIMEDPKKEGIGGVPKMLQDALAITFDNTIGHDYLEDFEKRLEAYWEEAERLPFDLEYFNLITRGGIPKKSLSVIMAGTGVGKTMLMGHMAAANLMMGKNVLYVTLEMAEAGQASIAERIDANLLGIPVEELVKVHKETYRKKVEQLREKTSGKLIIKEFPASSINSNHLRFVLNELRIKKNFIPDVIYVDYINLMVPVRAKMFGDLNSYSYVKMVAEELRGLAMEFETRVVTATQTNRSGYGSTDPDLTDTAESFGLPQTADFFVALFTSDDLKKLDQVGVAQLKNRWRDVDQNRRFVIGLDRKRMRYHDVEARGQTLNDVGSPVARAPVKRKFEGFS